MHLTPALPPSPSTLANSNDEFDRKKESLVFFQNVNGVGGEQISGEIFYFCERFMPTTVVNISLIISFQRRRCAFELRAVCRRVKFRRRVFNSPRRRRGSAVWKHRFDIDWRVTAF